MSSSLSVPLRSAVMIACVIGVPLAAVVGARRSPAEGGRDVGIQTAAAATPEPSPSPPAGQVATALHVERDEDRSAVQHASRTVPVSERVAAETPPPSSPVFWEDSPADANLGGEAHGRPSGSARPSTVKPGATDPAAAPLATETAAEQVPAPPRAGGTAPPMPSPDHFQDLEQRLRELGASHYRLETWGARGELFRFRCMMAVAGHPGHNRYFEATDPDALAAFERVLGQVERWHAGQPGGK